jgi:putative peptidoglycan lipid II flippase
MKIFGGIQKRISNLNSDHIAIARGMIWVAFFVFLGKIAGAAKEMAIAYRYGISNEVDAYLFIFNLISWPVSVWFSILTYVLVPLAVRIRENTPAELSRFRAELLAFALVLGVNLALLAWFGLPVLLRSSWLGLSAPTISIATEIVPMMVALAPLGILVSLFSAWMLSSGRHANTLLESVPAIAILVAVLVIPQNGVEPLVWGTLAGFIMHSLALASPLAWKRELEIPRFTSRSSQWPSFWQGFGVMLIGSGLGSFNGIIDQFFAAKLGVGAITTISYANRILALILGLGATAIGRATLPVFSRMKSKNTEQLQRVAMFWVWLMLAIGVVTMIISWWLAPWIVKLLFERGAFTVADTIVVTDIFRYGLGQVPFYFPSLALVTLLASHGKQKLIAISGATNLFVKTGANYFLIPLLGVKAILLSSGIMYMVSLFLLYWFATSLSKSKQTT